MLAAAGALVAVPGNHDIPYTFPARFSRPWSEWQRAFGEPDPVYRSDTLVVVGLNSVRPWRHQSGRLAWNGCGARRRASDLAAEGAAARRPPSPPGRVALARSAQASAREPLRKCSAHWQPQARARGRRPHPSGLGRTATRVRGARRPRRSGPRACDGSRAGPPRPHRSGEAQGLLLYEWDESKLGIVTYVLEADRFRPVAWRSFGAAALIPSRRISHRGCGLHRAEAPPERDSRSREGARLSTGDQVVTMPPERAWSPMPRTLGGTRSTSTARSGISSTGWNCSESLPYDSDEASSIRVARRDWEKARKVPGPRRRDRKVTADAEEAWTARAIRTSPRSGRGRPRPRAASAGQSRFAPYDDPYDPLLDDYEPGMKTVEVTPCSTA